VAYYRAPGRTGECAERILGTTIQADLVALDARTGRPCRDFGAGGKVSLLTGLGKVPDGYYDVTSAPTIIRGKIVLGGHIVDSQYLGEPSGVIRAYDATTGSFAWAFDMGRPGRHGEPPPGETYTHSTPNSWAPMSADETLGLVFVPTGNAVPDHYGEQRRPFDDQYSSSVLALDATSGEVRWSFQTVHHDLWDYDVPSQPTLVDLPGPAGPRRAVVQPTKRGEVFVLDAATGRPIRAVEERPAPQGATPDQRLAATQPYSVEMPSFRGADLTERATWGVTPFDHLWCRIKFRTFRYEGHLTPVGLKPALVWPGVGGAFNWGGVSVDPERRLMIANTNSVASWIQLIPRQAADARGIKPMGMGGRANPLVSFAQANTPFAAESGSFMSPLRVPCTAPPYGRLTAVSLDTGKVVWSHRLGSARDSGPMGLSSGLPLDIGTPNLGGSLVTRSGLVFIGATQERTFRAIDVNTGRVIWSDRLPAGGQATPMTYWSDRSKRQFVVIAAGGNSALQSKGGDWIIAYALPAPANPGATANRRTP